MTSMIAGLKDVPIDSFDDESLGLREYADALTKFVKECDTPMTIALQGDWGSGKTSLMNLLKHGLSSDNSIKTIWFNTWQYSSFQMADTLALSMLSSFVDEVAQGEDKSTIKKTLNLVGRLALKGATLAAGTVIGDREGLQDIVDTFGSEQASPAQGLKKLKDQLETSVELRSDVERFVIFIDDLDRLIPLRAVELLEVLKLFLDIKKCVYILACDYQVIVQGLKSKFGVGESELKGKSFFDKIIQVPFNMPLTQYRVEQYFQNLLDRIKVKWEPQDLDEYIRLVNHSVGFNPRSMKRLFNSLLLLHLVADQKDVLNGVKELGAKDNEISKILFAILCMQNAYEPVYRYMTRASEISDALFEKLRDESELAGSELFESMRNEFAKDKEGSFYKKLSRFMDTFYSAVQLDVDQQEESSTKLSSVEVETLRNIMNFSAVVSTESAGDEIEESERWKNREMVKSLIAELDDEFGHLIDTVRDKLYGNGFMIYQARGGAQNISLYISGQKEPWWGIEFGFGPEDMWAGVKAGAMRSISELRKLLEEKVKPILPNAIFDYWPDEKNFPLALRERVEHKGVSWDQRVSAFKDMVKEDLRLVLPVFVDWLKEAE